ncbi:MAG: sulfatase-like hydrolase/transferase, partial [Planctomycetota bacterium]|nr:sulfatase-like hydrolase/transferase [Planctomycetota bacterium]
MNRREFLGVLGAGAAAFVLPRCLGVAEAAAPAAARKPNVLFILADDLGWRDTSLYGSTFYETPNLERLAARGMMFTSAYAANPLCSPTRASIQTGLWPARIGITAPVCHMPEEKFEETVPERGPPGTRVLSCASATRLKLEYYTLAEAMHDAGYRTGHFGKWHLGQEPYDPLHQGYDVDVPHWGGPGPAGSYVAPWKFPAKLNFTGEPGEHLEDRMANEAAKFLKENKDRPFFMTYW